MCLTDFTRPSWKIKGGMGYKIKTISKSYISSGQTVYFNYIPLLICLDAHVQPVKHKGLVRNILWVEIFVFLIHNQVY